MTQPAELLGCDSAMSCLDVTQPAELSYYIAQLREHLPRVQVVVILNPTFHLLYNNTFCCKSTDFQWRQTQSQTRVGIHVYIQMNEKQVYAPATLLLDSNRHTLRCLYNVQYMYIPPLSKSNT